VTTVRASSISCVSFRAAHCRDAESPLVPISLPLSFTGGFSSESTAEAAEDQTRTRERVRASANLGKPAGFSPPFNTGFHIISRPLWRLVPGG
jgi:hypothetical protein